MFTEEEGKKRNRIPEIETQILKYQTFLAKGKRLEEEKKSNKRVIDVDRGRREEKTDRN